VLNGFNTRNSAGRQRLLTSEMTKKGEHYFNLEVLLMITMLCTGTWLSNVELRFCQFPVMVYWCSDACFEHHIYSVIFFVALGCEFRPSAS
jgi:hypothetical protein